ncbi:MAG: chloramphenicol acetyltransferase [Clostridia bacterium]|nr:chloramphenicol acetyltransferase [Clostridia bacterium]
MDLKKIAEYRVIDKETYYRKGVFRHFSKDCKCSTSMTARIDVTRLVEISKTSGTKFYLNFLYILTKALNSRDDYKMGYLWKTDELICYDVINPIQYVFHEDTETCTPVYTRYFSDYATFYKNAETDLNNGKATREYLIDSADHPNWFDASYIPWLSYDSLNIELPDGYLYFAPIVNWGKYRDENGRKVMPVSVRMNHAIADGYLIANVYRLIEKEIESFFVPELKQTKKEKL